MISRLIKPLEINQNNANKQKNQNTNCVLIFLFMFMPTLLTVFSNPVIAFFCRERLLPCYTAAFSGRLAGKR